MVTGVEVAGLVLGSFPILIEGLKVYGNGVDTIKKLRSESCKIVLDGFLRQIEIECVNYKGICERLLYERINTQLLEAITRDPRSPAWESTDVRLALKDCLTDQNIRLLDQSLNALGSLLESLAKDLRIGEDVEASPPTSSRKKLKSRILDLFSVIREDAIIMKVNNLKVYITEIENVCGRPSQPIPIGNTQTSTGAVSKYYSWIRSQSVQIHEILKETLLKHPSCTSCSFQHSVSMRITVRSLANTPKSRDDSSRSKLRFGVSVSANGENPSPPVLLWKEIDLEPFEHDKHSSSASPGPHSASNVLQLTPVGEVVVDVNTTVADGKKTTRMLSSMKRKAVKLTANRFRSLDQRSKSPLPFEDWPPSPSAVKSPPPEGNWKITPRSARAVRFSEVPDCAVNTEMSYPIDDLCEILRTPRVPDATCFGVLSSRSSSKIHIRVINGQLGGDRGSRPSRLVTLYELMSGGTHGKMTRRDQLIVGVVIASAVIQLHDTDWLPTHWAGLQVHFLWDSESILADVIKKPLLSLQTMPEARQVPEDSYNAFSHFPNRNLFTLGIILLEIFYNGPISDQLTEEEKKMDALAPGEYYGTCRGVRRVAENLAYEVGGLYAGAVQRCLTAVDYSRNKANLTNPGFKNDVYDQIVSPLEKNLEGFCCETLTDIFGESPALPLGYVSC